MDGWTSKNRDEVWLGVDFWFTWANGSILVLYSCITLQAFGHGAQQFFFSGLITIYGNPAIILAGKPLTRHMGEGS